MYDYCDEFLKALDFTETILSKKPTIYSQDGKILTEYVMKNLLSAIKNEFGLIDSNELLGNCFAVNYTFFDIIKKCLGCEIYYTIGWIQYDDKQVFYTQESELKRYAELGLAGLSSLKLNLHAWLTLPTMEIIDTTFQTTLGKILNKPEMIGGIITGNPTELSNRKLQYHPQIIGAEYLRKVGVLMNINILN